MSESKNVMFSGFVFLNAGLSGMSATCFVHPMDVIKNRLQMTKGNTSIVALVTKIVKDEGILKMYAGLSASLIRQASYTTVRLGTFNALEDAWRRNYTGSPSLFNKVLMAAVSGSVGAFVGTPADVALVRMSSDGRLPPNHRRNYNHALDAFIRICREEGVTKLWRGTLATIGRAIIVNVSQLTTYSEMKLIISKELEIQDGIPLHFSAAMVSGLITTVCSMPFDVTKTRLQNLQTTDKIPGMLKMMFVIAKHEGIYALWKGFLPTYCRIGPHTVLTFIFNEQMKRLFSYTFIE